MVLASTEATMLQMIEAAETAFNGDLFPPEEASRPLPRLYTPSEVATWLDVTEADLAKAREEGIGPRFVIWRGRHVRYPEPELVAWLRRSTLDVSRRRAA